MPLMEASWSFIERRCPNGWWFSLHLVNRVSRLQWHIRRLSLPYVKPDKRATPTRLIRQRWSWAHQGISTGPPPRREHRPMRDYRRRIRLVWWLCRRRLLVIGLKCLHSISCPNVASRKWRWPGNRRHRTPRSTISTAKTSPIYVRLLL